MHGLAALQAMSYQLHRRTCTMRMSPVRMRDPHACFLLSWS